MQPVPDTVSDGRTAPMVQIAALVAVALVVGAVWLGVERAPALLLDLARLAGCA